MTVIILNGVVQIKQSRSMRRTFECLEHRTHKLKGIWGPKVVP